MRMKYVTGTAFLIGLLAGASPLRAEVAAFDFKDPKGVNSIAFLLDSTLEPIMGVGGTITGTVDFDPSKPDATKGKVELEAASLHTANQKMKDVMHSSDWLDVAKHSKVTVDLKQIKEYKSTGENKFDLTFVADLTLKGTTKEITIPVSATYLPGQLGNRLRGAEGDLLVLRSQFSINRKDFGIKPDMGPDVVAEEVKVTVSIVGGAKK
jgi:polyisoprenoid-binding protein YceI